jgi:two-component system, NtrC family, response regulator AtoC
MGRFTVLVVDDERTLARSIKLFLEQQGYEAEVAEDGDRALELLERLRPDLVFADVRLPRMTGVELLRKIRAHDPAITVVMMTAYGTVESAVEAMKLGAFDYLRKPVDLDELKIIAERAQENRRLRQEVLYYREKHARNLEPGGLIGHSAAMEHPLQQVAHLASLPEAPAVLLTGETGTGKSLIARALHARSPRAGAPFIEIDCTSLPPTLIEAELFGYEKGSFTDARESKVGLIEAADGGTVFLDEVADLEPALQGKLLRAIEERTIRRVGSVRDRKVDAWIVAATNKDLEGMRDSGAFRKDLYYRLAVVTIHLPPLRDRGGDVGLLAESFLKRFAVKYGRRVSRLSAAALTALTEYPWPGNVRELRHVIERAVLAVGPDAPELDQSALGPLTTTLGPQPASFGVEPATVGSRWAPRDAGTSQDTSATRRKPPPEGMTLAESERAMIEQALREANGNQTRAARLLGVSRDTLRYRMAKFNIGR